MTEHEKEFSYQQDFPATSWEAWYEEVLKGLKGVPYDKALLTKTPEGITLKPIYTKDDVKDNPYLENLPGFAPYMRNTHVSGTANNSWLIEQKIDVADLNEWNQTVLSDLNKGQNAVYLKLDKISRQAKNPKTSAPQEIAQEGLSIFSLNQLKTALNEIMLENIHIDIEASQSALAISAMLELICEERKFDLKKIKGSVSTDPVSIIVREGSLNCTWKQAMDEMAVLCRWGINHAPMMKNILIDATIWNNAGASATQELAYAFSTAVLYISEMLDRGLNIDQIAPRIMFNLGIGKHLFMEISKLRAARLLWSQIIENFGGNAESQKMYIFAQSSEYNKTMFDPWVNILRTSTEAFSAVVGSCDALCLSPFDTSIKASDDFSRRIARNQQNILLEESHLNSVIDPAGGSWFVETLTQQILEKTWEIFQNTEKTGLFEALKNNDIHQQIEATHLWRLKNMAARKEALIGTTIFANLAEKELDIVNINYDKIYNESIAQLHPVSISLNMNDQLMDQIKAELKKGADLSAIFAELRKGQTADICITPIKERKLAEQYEYLRNASLEYKNKNGHLPQVYMANFAPIANIKPRMDFSQGFFQPGGFDVIISDYLDSVQKAIDASLASNAKAIIICSTDDTYPEIVPQFAQAIKKNHSDLCIILAGFPQDHIETFKQAGVDFFIHLKADTIQTLSEIMKKIGVL